jgi:murein DD-endopeptidase MepM/ murein hydrolase activator NlpD
LETVLLHATVGVQRVLARLRPDTTRPRVASRTHQRSLHAARMVQAHLDGTRRVTVRVAPADLLRRIRHPGITAQRALPIGVGSLVLAASFASYLPAGGGPTGGPTGDGPDVRLAIGGGFGLDRTGIGVDPAVLGGIAGSGDHTDAEPTRPLDFRPLVIEQVDLVPDEITEPTGADAPGEPVTGPFLADGTLVSGFAPDTTVEDGSALIRSYRVRSGDTLVGIADKFGISMMTLWWANDLRSKNDLHIGQTLTIPPVSGLVVDVTEADTLDSLAAKYDVKPKTILDANGLGDPNLVIGQTLVIPGARGAGIPTPKPTVRPAVKPRATSRPSSHSSGSSGSSGSSVRPPTTYHGGTMLWPVVGGGNYISQYFHYGHYGLDIAADAGSRVRAAAGGTVTFAGWKSNGGGYQVWIAHGSGLYTTYNHMSGVSVGVGQHVGRGQQVGRVGCTGNCTGPHLHFEVWRGPIWNGGVRVNPLRYL